jgi:ABC-2 type transport system ATP-binding protein
MTAVLEARALAKRYGRTWALRDCALSIPGGHVVALVGPNGAGKSTLLHIGVGLALPTEGTVSVLGNTAPSDPESLARVGFVAQSAPLYQTFSVSDMLHLGRAMNPRWDEGYAQTRLARLGIQLERHVGRLSGGQQAQVALSLALAKRPDLLLLDEPVADLDPLARHEFMGELMAAVAEHGISVVLSSHAIAELERTCDYLVLMSAGKVQVAGDVASLVDEHLLLAGPAAGAEQAAATRAVVRRSETGKQATLVVRDPGLAARASDQMGTTGVTQLPGTAAGLPAGWTERPLGLEELILAYLREPEASALPGPHRLDLAEEAGA